MAFTQGQRVRWTLKNGASGSGVCAADEFKGSVLVALDPVDPVAGKMTPNVQVEDLDFHKVIYCASTWLTLVP